MTRDFFGADKTSASKKALEDWLKSQPVKPEARPQKTHLPRWRSQRGPRAWRTPRGEGTLKTP